MSKNTDISELINYVSVNGSGHVVFTTVPSAASNTDKFLVSDSGVLKFRTAAQLLSDIGAQASGSYQAALSGTGFVKISGTTISYDNTSYLPLTGGTLGGGLTINGNTQGFGNLELLSGSGPYTLIGEGTGVNQYGVIDWDASNNRLRIATQPYAFGVNGGQITLTTGGLVGIGTTAPLEKLSVTGNLHVAGVGNNLYFDTDGTGRSISQFAANLYEFHILNSRGNSSRFILGNNSISLGTSATPMFHINTTTGNIGIGFTNPQYKLHVQDSANTGTIAFGHQSFPGLISCSASTGELRIDNRSSSSGFITFYPNGQTTVGSERMRITPGGNVGIGTTSPSVLLHLNTADTVNNIFRISNGTQQLNLGVNNSGGGSFIFESAAQALRFGTSDTERMRITSGGAVSINSGITNYHQLSIKSNGVLTYQGLGVYSSSNDRFISMNHTGTEGFIETENAGSGVMTPLSFKTGGSSRMTITSGGNIGIGVAPAAWANPAAGKVIQLGNRASVFSYNNQTLDLATNIYFDGSDYRYLESVFATLLRSDTSNGSFAFYNAPSGTSGNVVSFSESIRVAANGNLGIGTTNPQQKLSVEGSIRANRSIYNWYQNGTNSWDGFAFLHLKTNMSSGASGNVDYTMSLFTGRLYSYSSQYIREGSFGFHNWSGTIYNPVITGNFWSGGYSSSDGFVVLVVALGSGTYFGISIDWHQSYPYDFRNRIVTAATASNSGSGVF